MCESEANSGSKASYTGSSRLTSIGSAVLFGQLCLPTAGSRESNMLKSLGGLLCPGACLFFMITLHSFSQLLNSYRSGEVLFASTLPPL